MERADDLLPAVFISYAHEDKPFAHALAGALGERRCDVWVDEFELRAGDSLTERVSSALTSADFVVTIVSVSSVESNWCKRELQIALASGLASGRTIVLPLRLGNVTMPPSLTDIVYVAAQSSSVDETANRLVRDMNSHAADVEARRNADVTEREWQFAVEPAHSLDSLLGDLEQEMGYLWDPGCSRKGQTTYEAASARWSAEVDKWLGGSRLPAVLRELAWRLESLLEVATHHERAYRRSKGTMRRLNRIVGTGILQTRQLMSEAAKNPELFAPVALEDSTIPDRDPLLALVESDPRLFALEKVICLPEDDDQRANAATTFE